MAAMTAMRAGNNDRALQERTAAGLRAGQKVQIDEMKVNAMAVCLLPRFLSVAVCTRHCPFADNLAWLGFCVPHRPQMVDLS